MIISKYQKASIFVLLVGSIALSCSKPATTNNVPPKPTNRAKLQISVTDALGNGTKIASAKVQLFHSNNDRLNNTNAATTMRVGDANGVVVFDSLQEAVYYFNAYDNSQTQSNATTSNYTPKLVNDVTTKVSTGVK